MIDLVTNRDYAMGPMLACPECGDEYQHATPEKARLIEGEDNYAAGWKGRGDLFEIPFWSECGSRWELGIGFHKGMTFLVYRVRKSCKGKPGEPSFASTWRHLLIKHGAEG